MGRAGHGIRCLLCCGLLGVGAAFDALAAYDEAATDTPRETAASDRRSVALLQLPGLAPAPQWSSLRPALDDSLSSSALVRESQGRSALAWRYTEGWRQLRGGVGLDMEVAGAGNLHLTLLPARDSEMRGMRWALDGDGDGSVRGARLWSLGASFDMVRTVDYGTDRASSDRRFPHGSRRVVLSPQLVLDLDRLAHTAGNAQLTLQHANWRERDSRALPDRVWQLSLRWRF